MKVVEKCRSEAGRLWHNTRLYLTFYPSLLSRLTSIDPSNDIVETKWHSFKTIDGGPGKGLRRHEAYRLLVLREGGEDVRRWMANNLTGRAELVLVSDHTFDRYLTQSDFLQRGMTARFAKSADAVKFKLCLL